MTYSIQFRKKVLKLQREGESFIKISKRFKIYNYQQLEEGAKSKEEQELRLEQNKQRTVYRRY